MNVMKIGNYTTQYSSNKTQQSSNPSFGKIVDVKTLEEPIATKLGALIRKVGTAIDNTFGFRLNHVPDTARRIVGFADSQQAVIQVYFDKSIQHLSEEARQGFELTVVNGPNGIVSASIAGKHTQKFGAGQVLSKGDDVGAAQQAITDAWRDYKYSAGSDRAYGFLRKGALMETARKQDLVARFTEGL